MKVLLLLAGQSKRFWPLTEKPLFPVVGKALLEHVVNRLEGAGCTEIILIGSKDNLEEAGRLYPKFPIVEQENLNLGMRGALLSSLPALGNSPILIAGASDVIDAAAYKEVVEKGQSVDGAILAQRVSRYFPGGYVSVDGNRVTGIVEKPGEGNEPSDLVNIVCHYHSDASVLLKELQNVDESTDDGYEQALAKLFKSQNYAAVPYEGYWQPVKYPWHLLQLLPIVLPEISSPAVDPSASIHPTAVIEGNVIIEANVKVLPHATVKGPCFIGAHSIIGNNALVRGSSIGEHCVIGYNTEVKDSVLSHHVWTHSTYIGDSVIGENVSFGAGSVTGNLRLDEAEIQSSVREAKIGTGLMKFGTIIGSDVRVGIHTGINPGIKIGSSSFIGSGVLVSSDIPDRSFVVMKNGEMHVRENKTEVKKPDDRTQFRKKI